MTDTLELQETQIPEHWHDLLEGNGFAHMATIGPDGEPHTSPVWYDWDGTHILISHTKQRQKYRNVVREPRVALSILDPENPYRYVEIRGIVSEIEEDPDKNLINALAKKYQGLDSYPYDGPGDDRVIFKVTATKVSGNS